MEFIEIKKEIKKKKKKKKIEKKKEQKREENKNDGDRKNEVDRGKKTSETRIIIRQSLNHIRCPAFFFFFFFLLFCSFHEFISIFLNRSIFLRRSLVKSDPKA